MPSWDARDMSDSPASPPGITGRGIELPKDAGPNWDAPALAVTLLRTARAGTLATLDPATGYPLATLVNVATDVDGAPLLLTSRLSLHTRNMEADARVSLLVAAIGRGDPLAHPRLTVSGRAARSPEPRLRRRFLARHPKAMLYAGLPDFSFWRVEIDGVHVNGGFGRAATLAPADILVPLAGAESLVEAEEDILAQMNHDHAEAVRLYATRLAGAADGEWRLTGIDPCGIDLALGDETARVAFTERVDSPGALRAALVAMAAKARAATAA